MSCYRPDEMWSDPNLFNSFSLPEDRDYLAHQSYLVGAPRMPPPPPPPPPEPRYILEPGYYPETGAIINPPMELMPPEASRAPRSPVEDTWLYQQAQSRRSRLQERDQHNRAVLSALKQQQIA